MKFLKALVFWPCVWVYTIFMVLKLVGVGIYYRFKDPMDKENRCHDIATQWGTGILKFTPGWEFEVTGMENIPNLDEKPVVLVANHQSSVDILALYTLGVQFRWLSKIEVFRLPFVGQAMTMSGYIPINRGSKGSHQNAFLASKKCLQRGISMAYFPEGSRSLDGKLKEFKQGAFRLAEEEGVQILPITISGTNRMMAKNSFTPNPAKISLKVLKPCQRMDDESLSNFMDRVRSNVHEELELGKQQEANTSPIFSTATI